MVFLSSLFTVGPSSQARVCCWIKMNLLSTLLPKPKKKKGQLEVREPNSGSRYNHEEPKKNLVHVLEFYVHISDITGSDGNSDHLTTNSWITAPPGRHMESPGRVQPEFCGCKVPKCKAHFRYKSGDANQLLHPHVCIQLWTCMHSVALSQQRSTCVFSAHPRSHICFGQRGFWWKYGAFTQSFIFSLCLAFSELSLSFLHDFMAQQL